MHYDQEGPSFSADQSQESFLGSFSRVPSGLDPTEVYSHFIKMSARIRQLEEQTKQVSAPFLLEAALREASEVRTQSARAAERTYNEIVRAAQDEAARIKREAEQQANETIQSARASLADVQQQADELIEQARREAVQIRHDAETFNDQTEQELERLCVDFANFLQRLLDRRNAARGTEESASAGAAASAIASLSQDSAARVEPREAPAPPAGPPLWSSPAATQNDSLPTFRQMQPEVVAERSESAAVERPNGTPPWASSPATSAPAPEWSSAPAPSSSPAPHTPTAPPPPAVHGAEQEQQPPRIEEQATDQKQDQDQKPFRLPSWLDL